MNLRIALISLVGASVASASDSRALRGGSCSSIAEIACNTDGFSTLCAAVQAAGLAETLDKEGPFTVFAPNDEAFANLPDGTVEALLGDIPALTNILLFHAIAEEKEAEDLKCKKKYEMVNGDDSRTICKGGKIYQKGKGNPRDDRSMWPEIIATDIAACNGVVHVVDQVMLPP